MLLRKAIPPVIFMTVLFLIDITLDIHEKIEPKHLLVEALIFLVIFYIAYLFYRFYTLQQKTFVDVEKEFVESNSKIKYWQQQNKSLIDGLAKKIHEEFCQWKLTKAESEVALLIIKGFSLEDISKLRGTSERTIRDQAASVYSKAKLKNRIELSAYFLEDLLSPSESTH